MTENAEIHGEAVLFDLDGTLIDSTAAVVRSWLRWAAEFEIDPRRLRGSHGRPAAEIVADLVAVQELARASARIDELEITDTDGVVPLPGSLDLIGALPADSWAIVTSCTAPLAAARIASAGIPEPGVLVTASDVTRGKPDPECWLLAAQRLGIDPADCIVVEDAPAGIAGARAAGMQVVAVTTTHGPEELTAADAIVSGPAELWVGAAVGGGLRLKAVGAGR